MRLSQRCSNRWYVFVALILLLGSAVRAEEQDAAALVKRVTDAIPKSPFVSSLELSSPDFETRKIEVSRKYVKGAHGTYLEVTAPEMLEGIRFLFLERPDAEDEQYIKVAASRSSVRVSNEIRRRPYLGSAFYVSDLVMPELDRFTYRFVGEEELLGRHCKLVEMTPKDVKKEVYGKTILALDPADSLILRRQFFDKDGKLFKVWTIDKVEKIDGFWTLSGQAMVNVQDGRNSRLDISAITYNAELPDTMFTPKYLLR